MRKTTEQKVYWSLLIYKQWSLFMAATSKGLCYVGSQSKPFEELEAWINRRFPGCEILQDDEELQPYAAQMAEYLGGTRQRFSLPFDLNGTAFQLAVWEALRSIPYGVSSSYSEIAHEIQKPAAVRAVGAAIGANPVLITVPCHRVIGKNGALTGYRGGLDMKKQLLQLERERSAEVEPLHA